MKIIMVECTAEELRANRTVMDSVTDALSNFTRVFCEFNSNNEEEEESEE